MLAPILPKKENNFFPVDCHLWERLRRKKKRLAICSWFCVLLETLLLLQHLCALFWGKNAQISLEKPGKRLALQQPQKPWLDLNPLSFQNLTPASYCPGPACVASTVPFSRLSGAALIGGNVCS